MKTKYIVKTNGKIIERQYSYMPACLMGKFSIEGKIEVIECY